MMREGSGAEDMDGSLVTQIRGHSPHTKPSPVLSPGCTSSCPTLSQGVTWCPKGVLAQDSGSTPEQSPGSTFQSLTPTQCLFPKGSPPDGLGGPKHVSSSPSLTSAAPELDSLNCPAVRIPRVPVTTLNDQLVVFLTPSCLRTQDIRNQLHT